ncbi:uncharacterized protein PHACADRAFT_266096 [Phanerochaete carnosa HHB-10118-sp]|uniref:Uncharacterized protein n=1 Tax=Phanerochaete carnosa (strain HHB-10118-sp) TaxID=650164 RepID=K5VCL1_PHACS|nr:uncharacterized protein PHACADRAFT_266096 [Phanerochaete carnosa HHB-10118-sp]EKM48798.1 hypothetical protein PHACADRAFT_266096 [Phanerochaete carnosa HHB-10118-sp]
MAGGVADGRAFCATPAALRSEALTITLVVVVLFIDIIILDIFDLERPLIPPLVLHLGSR